MFCPPLLFPEQKQDLTLNLTEDKISIVNFFTQLHLEAVIDISQVPGSQLCL